MGDTIEWHAHAAPLHLHAPETAAAAHVRDRQSSLKPIKLHLPAQRVKKGLHLCGHHAEAGGRALQSGGPGSVGEGAAAAGCAAAPSAHRRYETTIKTLHLRTGSRLQGRGTGAQTASEVSQRGNALCAPPKRTARLCAVCPSRPPASSMQHASPHCAGRAVPRTKLLHLLGGDDRVVGLGGRPHLGEHLGRQRLGHLLGRGGKNRQPVQPKREPKQPTGPIVLALDGLKSSKAGGEGCMARGPAAAAAANSGVPCATPGCPSTAHLEDGGLAALHGIHALLHLLARGKKGWEAGRRLGAAACKAAAAAAQARGGGARAQAHIRSAPAAAPITGKAQRALASGRFEKIIIARRPPRPPRPPTHLSHLADMRVGAVVDDRDASHAAGLWGDGGGGGSGLGSCCAEAVACTTTHEARRSGMEGRERRRAYIPVGAHVNGRCSVVSPGRRCIDDHTVPGNAQTHCKRPARPGQAGAGGGGGRCRAAPCTAAALDSAITLSALLHLQVPPPAQDGVT